MSEYTDLVVWTNDVPGLVDEAVALGFTSWLKEDELGEYSLGGDRTPLITKWPESMALIRATNPEGLSAFTKMQVLGQFVDGSFVAVSDVAQAKYDKLYPRTSYFNSLSGEEQLPPEQFGSFG